jgi:hypothetical protein
MSVRIILKNLKNNTLFTSPEGLKELDKYGTIYPSGESIAAESSKSLVCLKGGDFRD